MSTESVTPSQPTHPLSSPSPAALYLSQHQGLLPDENESALQTRRPELVLMALPIHKAHGAGSDTCPQETSNGRSQENKKTGLTFRKPTSKSKFHSYLLKKKFLMENMLHTAIIETCKSEPQGGITLCRSERPSAKRLQTINAETPRRKGSSPTRLMKMKTGNMHSGEQCVEVLYKLGTKLLYDLATPALDLPSEKHRI